MTVEVDWSKAPRWATVAAGRREQGGRKRVAFWFERLPERNPRGVFLVSGVKYLQIESSAITYGPTGVPDYWQIPRPEPKCAMDFTGVQNYGHAPTVETEAGEPYCAFCNEHKSVLDANDKKLVVSVDVTICEDCIAFAQTQVDAMQADNTPYSDLAREMVGVEFVRSPWNGRYPISIASLHDVDHADEQYTLDVAGYESLARVFVKAYEQSAVGKGKARHANNLPFSDQPMQRISTLLDNENGMAFQAMKKIQEGLRLPHEAKINELLGAMVYIAGMVIWLEKNKCSTTPTAQSANRA